MKQIVNINLITGLYNEWTETMNIEVDEDFDSLIKRMRTSQIRGTTIIPVKTISGAILAVNIDYITDMWIKGVGE